MFLKHPSESMSGRSETVRHTSEKLQGRKKKFQGRKEKLSPLKFFLPAQYFEVPSGKPFLWQSNPCICRRLLFHEGQVAYVGLSFGLVAFLAADEVGYFGNVVHRSVGQLQVNTFGCGRIHLRAYFLQ